VLWLLPFACVHPAAVAPELTPPTVDRAVMLAGQVSQGRFVDASWGYSVPVPAGWSVHPADIDDAVRVVMVDPDERVRLRVSVVPATSADPACELSFTDDLGHDFGALHDVRIGTCAESAQDANGSTSRVLSWWAVDATPPIRVEVELAPGYLVVAEQAAAGVLVGFQPRSDGASVP
jgi:hypothetical protein